MSNQKSVGAVIKKGLLTSLVVFLKTIKWGFIALIVGCFLVGGASVGYVASLVKDEPVRERSEILAKINQNSETSFAYFSDGTPIGQLRSDIDQQMAENHEIPQSLKDAVVAVEDSDFDDHYGVDVTGFLRAVKEKVLNEENATGGSTITQQLVKNTFFSLKPTMDRKARELFLALRVERYLSKTEILLAYLNKSPFGKGATGYNVYGIKAAAKGIFGVNSLHELNIAQSAYLAGLPKSPDQYRAYYGDGGFYEAGFIRAIERQHHVLDRMLITEKITQEEYDEAINFDLKSTLAEEKQRAYSDYPYLMAEIERRAAETLALSKNPQLSSENLDDDEHADIVQDAERDLLTGGYHIHTTIDKELYHAYRDVAQNEDNFLPFDEERGHEQIGAILLDNKTSAILAMIEGRDYYIEQMNHATQMERQPGSTMKPIAAFLPALESGAIQPASIIDDIPILLEDGSKKHPHMPNNWDMNFHGLITARHALDRSYNVPALKLFNEVVGIEEAWSFARKLGITTLTEEDNHARTGVIGGLTNGTRLDEMTNAYTSIANQGQYNDTYMISRIVDHEEDPVYEHKTVPTPVFSEQTAFLMTDMLRTVITNRVGTAYDIQSKFKHYAEIPVVGKTGSTQNDRDAWFIGYSPDITVGVWAGHDNNKPMITWSDLPQQASTQRAKNIWSILMDTTVELRPELFKAEAFEQPDKIEKMTVSSVSGDLPSELVRETGNLNTDIFNSAWVPTKVDDSLVKMGVIRYNGKNYIPQSSTPSDMINEEILIKRKEPIYEILDRIKEILEDTPLDQRPKKGGYPMTLANYQPEDFHKTAPVEVDPRSYEQKRSELSPLQPPTGLQLENFEGKNKISFNEINNPNVVGYRFYRAYAGREFQLRPNQKIFAGDTPLISDWVTDQYDYAYYITAVDILGRESAPSERIYDIKTKNPPRDWVEGTDLEKDKDPDTTDPGTTDPGTTEPGTTDPDEDDPQTEGPVPSSPQEVMVESKDNGISVEISWKHNPTPEQVLHYVVYYSKQADGDYREIKTTDTTSIKYIAIPAEGWYRVVAVNENGPSEPSTAVELSAQTAEEE